MSRLVRELRDFAGEFGEVRRSLPFQLPENFLLIIRAMSLTSGALSSPTTVASYPLLDNHVLEGDVGVKARRRRGLLPGAAREPAVCGDGWAFCNCVGLR
ncbi:hypothetical protein CVS30_02440 [Arthrobacter psychrolactophilus]|uniref:Uncharacterized protein n=1 Tax=Arthrobacter psychrolactophilus TaxID=92442 RepID=A0A2V5IVU4_9MICC|nr:hypothetical protein CVS30_02440 [Arthrobacter psychrolactophilus]